MIYTITGIVKNVGYWTLQLRPPEGQQGLDSIRLFREPGVRPGDTVELNLTLLGRAA